jgi:DNA repair exonuclease SbcCD ATPase subunit
MRAAQETLNGPELRELSARRAAALDGLVGRLPDAAADLRQLLERSIAEPHVAEDLLAGRLVTMPEGGGWAFGDAQPMSSPPVTRKGDVDRKRAEERRQAQQDFDAAEAAESEARQELDAAEEKLRSLTERVQQLQTDLAAARQARDDAAEAARQSRQEAQRRAKDARTAQARLQRL